MAAQKSLLGESYFLSGKDRSQLSRYTQINPNSQLKRADEFTKKKYDKIEKIKQEMESSALQECSFTPDMPTKRKKGHTTSRDLGNFLMDQHRFLESK